MDIKYLVVNTRSVDDYQSVIEEYLTENIDVYVAADHDFSILSDAQSPQGILAVVSMPLVQDSFRGNIVVLDSIVDPGNLGTIIRTCDWFGFQNIILGQRGALISIHLRSFDHRWVLFSEFRRLLPKTWANSWKATVTLMINLLQRCIQQFSLKIVHWSTIAA